MNNKMNAVKRDEMTRRTVYVSDIDQQVRGFHPQTLLLMCLALSFFTYSFFGSWKCIVGD